MTAEITALLDAVTESTSHLERSLVSLTDDQARGDSLLPGWTRGHVLSHLARNADALVNLTVWARTGVETPMYPSREVRAATIEAQSGRPAAELVADVHEASQRFMAALEGLSPDEWSNSWGTDDDRQPATEIPRMRRSEVEVHHVDLNLDYTLAHWPEDFVEQLLTETVDQFSERSDQPGLVLVGNDEEGTWTIGDGGQLITGPPPALLGWLIGRSDGIGLHSDQPLPDLGAWK